MYSKYHALYFKHRPPTRYRQLKTRAATRLLNQNRILEKMAFRSGGNAQQQQMQAMQLQLQMEQMSYMQKSFSRFVPKPSKVTALRAPL